MRASPKSGISAPIGFAENPSVCVAPPTPRHTARLDTVNVRSYHQLAVAGRPRNTLYFGNNFGENDYLWLSFIA